MHECDVKDLNHRTNMTLGPLLEEDFTDWAPMNFNSAPLL